MASEHDSWEFNCPQYVDFQSAGDENADTYFDVDHESDQTENSMSNGLFREVVKSAGQKNIGKFALEKKIEGLESPAVSSAKRKPLSVLQPHNANQRKNYELRLTPYRDERSKSYCSAYVDSRVSLTSVNQMKNSNKEKEKQYSLRMTPARKRKTKSCFMFRNADLEGVAKHPDVYSSHDIDKSKRKREQLVENEGSEVGADPRITSPAVEISNENSRMKRTASPEPETFVVKRAKLAPPQLQKPQQKYSSNQGKKFKTTEEKELMKMKQLRYDFAQQRAKNTKYMNKAINADFSRKISDSVISQHTVTKPFHFRTDERIRDARPVEQYKHVDFSSQLRRQSPRVTKAKMGRTKFQPFHFATDKRKAQQDPKVDDQGPRKKPKMMSISLPQSPALKAVKRNRPVTALSRQQIEELEAQEMRKYKFHAKDFDPSVFTKVALPKVSTKPSTKPEAIELATEKRFKNKEVKKPAEEKFEFHAQPAPKQILAAPTGVKPKTIVPPTEPKSPVFALKLRSQKWKEHPSSILDETNDHQVSIFKAHPVPDFKAPAPLRSSKKCTVIEPFSFDQKDQERAYLKEQKVCEEIEKRKSVYNFRAQPIPDLSGTSGIPKKETKPITKVEPFQLQIDKLAQHKIDKWQKGIENQLAQEREAAVFKAAPALVIKKPPFQPEKSARPPTVTNTFQLETVKRAEQRAMFEDHVQAVEAENRVYLLHLQQEKERKEREEIALRRKESVHKAQPVRHYKPVEIKPSEKPLTEPSSPHFATSLRIKQRL